MKSSRYIVRHAFAFAAATLVGAFGFALTGYSQIAPVDPIWTFTGNLRTNRYGHTATLLLNGKILVAGGGGFPCSGGGCYSTVNSTAELYDPSTATWSYTGSLRRRTGHSATLLGNGQVLVAGGVNYGYDIGKFSYVTTAELYNPETGRWRLTGGLKALYAGHAATLLQNGKVLLVGTSLNTSISAQVASDSRFPSAELYDPDTETWNSSAAPTIAGPLTLLPDGTVLVVSGGAAELYHPDTETWSSAGNLNVIRSVRTATLLNNGTVLITGEGESSSAGYAEIYDPAMGIWSTTSNPFTVRGGTATLMSDGKVLLAGGYDSLHPVSGEELYDPTTGTWSLTSHLNDARAGHTASLLPDGKVLVAGGVDGDFDIGTIFHDTAELYGPVGIPKISAATVLDKKLFVKGENFEPGAVILINGESQKTANDIQSPKSELIGKKAGKKIKAGDTLQVRNPNGTLSQEFIFEIQ